MQLLAPSLIINQRKWKRIHPRHHVFVFDLEDALSPHEYFLLNNEHGRPLPPLLYGLFLPSWAYFAVLPFHLYLLFDLLLIWYHSQRKLLLNVILSINVKQLFIELIELNLGHGRRLGRCCACIGCHRCGGARLGGGRLVDEAVEGAWDGVAGLPHGLEVATNYSLFSESENLPDMHLGRVVWSLLLLNVDGRVLIWWNLGLWGARPGKVLPYLSHGSFWLLVEHRLLAIRSSICHSLVHLLVIAVIL